MQHGITNCNEFYTSNYWHDVLAKELASKVGTLPGCSERLRSLRELDRFYWTAKECLGSRKPGAEIVLMEFYGALLKALNFAPQWTKRQAIEDGTVFAAFSTYGSGNSRCDAYVVTESGTEEFAGTVFSGDQLSEGEATDNRCINDILDEEFLTADPPLKWALVLTPEALFLAERTKWPNGRFIKIEWDTVFMQRSVDVYQEILGLCAREHLVPDDGISIHDEWDDSSHRHAYAVTTALRESVRQGIEDLVNEMVVFRRMTHQKFMPDGEPESFARELTRDALFFVYRIIFLMYVEAQGDDADTLPLKSGIYRGGYSIEKLVEISQRDLAETSPEYNGYFLHDSLNKIFALIREGFNPKPSQPDLGFDGDKKLSRTGFFVKGLKADLFDPAQIRYLNGVRFRNHVVQKIIKRLAFTKGEGRRGQVGRVSYANLGINQLGAVYEGLLSYTGYFAKEPLVGLKSSGTEQIDIDRGRANEDIYLCPKSLAETYRKHRTYKLTDDHFVRVSIDDPRFVEYPRGSFIYRMAGRDRQKLASYYTPESLTKLTVKYALKVLLEKKQTPEELLSLKILEPAMGSGAFLSEAVAQLADVILDLEVKRDPKAFASPEERRRRKNEVKYHLVSHCIYGVDLNPTAIELAKFSLWLGCIGAGKDPPDFSGRLKLGNSLIGARFDKTSSGIYPWLALDDGMMNYGNKLRDYDLDGAAQLRDFRRSLLSSQLRADLPAVQKAQKLAEALFAQLPDPQALQCLKLSCDLWCALFFLGAAELSEGSAMPRSHEELIQLQVTCLEGNGLPQDVAVVVSRIVDQERFFHWDLEFSDQLRSGGFDLILANPPWVAVGWQDALYVSDLNPIPAALELNAANTRTFVKAASDAALNQYLATDYVRVEAYTQMLNVPFYADMRGSQKNTYKAFDVLMMRVQSPDGAIGVIQEDGVLDDEDGVALREGLYRRFRYHFQFQNEFDLFAEVHNAKRYSVNVLGGLQATPNFVHIGNLFLAGTVDACFAHDAPHDPVPLIKTPAGDWETRGHRSRVVPVGGKAIRAFGEFLNQQESPAPAFLNLHSTELLGFVAKIGACTTTLGDLAGEENCVGSPMFDETYAQDDGWTKKSPGRAASIDRVVLSGPNIEAGNPLAKNCRVPYRQNKDYDPIDLTTIPADYIPRTVYQFVGDITKVDGQFPELRRRPYRSYYRLAQRGMINAANERCLFTAIVPPGSMHINGIKSVAFENAKVTALGAGYCSSLVIDGVFRLRNRSNFFVDDFIKTPVGSSKSPMHQSIQRRALALNCLTSYYSQLWTACFELAKSGDGLINGMAFGDLSKPWQPLSALRHPTDREQALIEIDALVALSFGLTETELTQIYEILFPVLNKYDREAGFDRKGKLIEAHRFFSERGW